MNRRAILPLVVGLGIGLLAVKFAVNTIRKAQASSGARQTITVVRAKQDIAAHEEIQKEMVEAVETVESLFTPAKERLDKVETAIGRVTAKPIIKHAPVLLSMLAAEGTRPGMVGRIPQGFRAVSVRIDEVSGVAYQMQPGDWVDVIVVMDIDTGVRGKKETIAEVILQHIQVAAIGYGTNPEPEKSPSKLKPAKSATLMVPEEDVPKLHLAGTRGKITLAMRGEDDKTQNASAVAFGSEIMGPGARGQAPRIRNQGPGDAQSPTPPVQWLQDVPEPAPHLVLMFRGRTMNQPATVEQITFENAHSSRVMDITLGPPTDPEKKKRKKEPTRAQPGSETQAGRVGDEADAPGEPGAREGIESNENDVVEDNTPEW